MAMQNKNGQKSATKSVSCGLSSRILEKIGICFKKKLHFSPKNTGNPKIRSYHNRLSRSEVV